MSKADISSALHTKVLNIMELKDGLTDSMGGKIFYHYNQLIRANSGDATDTFIVKNNISSYTVFTDNTVVSLVLEKYSKYSKEIAAQHAEYKAICAISKGDFEAKLAEAASKMGIPNTFRLTGVSLKQVKEALGFFSIDTASQDEIAMAEKEAEDMVKIPDSVLQGLSESDEEEPDWSFGDFENGGSESGFGDLEGSIRLREDDIEGEPEIYEEENEDEWEFDKEEISQEKLAEELRELRSQQEAKNRASAEMAQKFSSETKAEAAEFRASEDLDVDAVELAKVDVEESSQMTEVAEKELAESKKDEVWQKQQEEREKKQQEADEKAQKQLRLKELYRDEPAKDVEIPTISAYSESSANAVVDMVMSVYDSIFPEIYQSKTLGILTDMGVMNLDEANRIHLDVASSIYAKRIYKCMLELAGNKLRAMPYNENLSGKYITNDFGLTANYCPYRQVLNIYGVYVGQDNKRHRKKSWKAYRPILLSNLRSEVFSIYKNCEKNIENFGENGEQIELQQSLYKLYTTMIIVRALDTSKELSLSICSEDIVNKAQFFNALYQKNPWGISPTQTSIMSNVTIANGVHNFLVVFNKTKSSGEIYFAHKALEAVLSGGGKVGANEIIIGKGLDGTYVRLNMLDEQLKVMLIAAGSRSGKGVLTLSLIANLIANRIPIGYLDYKPDSCAGLWEIERTTGYKVFAVDGKNGVTKDGDKSPQIPNYPVNFPSISEIKNHLHMMGYLKGLISMLAVTFARKAGTGGFNGCNLNKDKMVFILDEAMVMNQGWGMLTSSLKDAKKKYGKKGSGKDGEESTYDEKKFKYCERLEKTLDIFHNLQEFVNSTAAESKVTAIVIGQRTDIGSWKQPSSPSLAKDPMGCLVGGTTLKLIGRNAAQEVNSSNVSGKEYLSKTGYFAVVQGDKVVGDTESGKGNTTVCKTYMVLNKNDYDADPNKCGVFTKSLLMNLTDQATLQSCIEDLCPDGVRDERCGFNGLVDYIAKELNANSEGGKPFNIGESANLGYRSIELMMQGVGLIGGNSKYRTVEEWIYDCSYDSLFTVEDFQDAITRNMGIWDVRDGGSADADGSGSGSGEGGSSGIEGFQNDEDLFGDEPELKGFTSVKPTESNERVGITGGSADVFGGNYSNVFGGAGQAVKSASANRTMAEIAEAEKRRALEERRKAEEERLRAAQKREAEQRAAEQRAAEQRAAEQRAAEQREAEQRAARDLGDAVELPIGNDGEVEFSDSEGTVLWEEGNEQSEVNDGQSEAGTQEIRGEQRRSNGPEITIDGKRLSYEEAQRIISLYRDIEQESCVSEPFFKKKGSRTVILPRNTSDAYALDPDNYVGVMGPFEGFKAKLFQTRTGTSYEFKRRWSSILKSIKLMYRNQSNLVTRVVLGDERIYVNGKMVDVGPYIGGQFDIRMCDIINIHELMKQFKGIKELTLDAMVYELFTQEYGSTANEMYNIFRQNKALATLNLCDLGTFEIKASMNRQSNPSNTKEFEEEAQEGKIRRALDTVSKHNNPNKKNMTPGEKSSYQKGYEEFLKTKGKGVVDRLWNGNILTGTILGGLYIGFAAVGGVFYGVGAARRLRKR